MNSAHVSGDLKTRRIPSPRLDFKDLTEKRLAAMNALGGLQCLSPSGSDSSDYLQNWITGITVISKNLSDEEKTRIYGAKAHLLDVVALSAFFNNAPVKSAAKDFLEKLGYKEVLLDTVSQDLARHLCAAVDPHKTVG
jgi:hypothetical protein